LDSSAGGYGDGGRCGVGVVRGTESASIGVGSKCGDICWTDWAGNICFVVKEDTGRDCIVISLAVILAIVQRIHLRVPELSVHGAHLALRDVVLIQDISVVELAKPGRLSRVLRMINVVLRCRLADRFTALLVEWGVIGEQTHAHVRVVIVTVHGGVDCLGRESAER
jgi:hypothetical protein